MKIIYTTDTHGKSSNPSSRLDDFPAAVIRKLEYIGRYGKQLMDNGEEVIFIHGGDWIDSPDVSEKHIRDMAQTVNSWPFKRFGILGNHDVYGYNPETFMRTPLAIAEGLEMFHRLNNTPTLIEGSTAKIALTGVDSFYDLDREGFLDLYNKSEYVEGYLNIRVIHGMLLKKKVPMYSCTAIEDIKECDADVILTGHDHVGFGVICENGRYFCNPGSLLRVTAGNGDIRRDVRFALITVENDVVTNFELINLPEDIAQPSHLVLDEEKLKEEKANKERIENLMTKVYEAKKESSFDIYESLNELCNSNSISEEDKKMCLHYLSQAEESLNGKKG